ncbi:SH3 domain-containing protein [Azospirillum sp.]|uniref:SH3 domain-containing protein n=1 Tax=Azospirillum sp. TaxID=34012 RepID=UPI00260B3A00|nr:SH3 domain-containing protein [Azospirillum sp.]
MKGATALLALLALAPATLIASSLAAAPTEERVTPAPLPTAALPRLTPLGAVAVQPFPVVPPQLAPPLSPARVPGAPPKVATAKTSVAAAKPPVAETAAPPAVKPAEPPKAPVAETVAPPVEAAPAPIEAPSIESPRDETPKAEAPKPEAPSNTANRRAVITTAGVYLRATPASNGRVLDALDRGEKLEVVGTAPDGWTQVGRKGKSIGYIAAGYLADVPNTGKTTGSSIGGDAPAPAASAPTSYAKAARGDRGCALPDDRPAQKQRTTLPVGAHARATADANLRVAPACDAKVLDVLDAGERVTIQAVNGSWYRVARRNRTVGYVGAALLVGTSER